MRLKRLIFFTVISLCNVIVSVGQGVNDQLIEADSLFEQQKFTEAYQIYTTIYDSTAQYSNQMLLKMAYIKEGLADHALALFYLNQYYAKTQDDKVLAKIKEIAEQKDLVGYQVDDTTYVYSFFSEYGYLVVIVLLAIALALTGHVFFKRWQNKKEKEFAGTPYLSVGLSIFLCLTALLVNNFPFQANDCLVAENHTILMNAPSSGADVIDIISKGHKLTLLAEETTWSKVMWGDQVAFVKTKNINPL